MHIAVNQSALYAYSAGKAFNPAQPTVIFIHGVLNDHSVWILQSRYFAHHGWNVLAIDLPGHCKSEGAAPSSVEEGASAVIGLLDALTINKAALVGHSFGALIALEAAAQAPEKISHLAMLGVAYPMRVSPALIDASIHAPMKAIDMVNQYSHSTLAPPPSALGPGTWVAGASKSLMRRVLASNRTVNVFNRGFVACDSYQGGNQAMLQVRCPTLFILGELDQMTPKKSVQSLIDKAKHATVVTAKAGHSLMTEAPETVLNALKEFLTPQAH